MCDLLKTIMSSSFSVSDIFVSYGNRQRFTIGGNYEQRTFGSPTSDQTATCRSVSRRALSDSGAQPCLVPHLVASLSSIGPQRTVRSDACQCATSSDHARTGTNHPEYSSTAGVTSPSRNTLQSHWGQFHCSRTPGVAHSTCAERAHYRTRVGA